MASGSNLRHFYIPGQTNVARGTCSVNGTGDPRYSRTFFIISHLIIFTVGKNITKFGVQNFKFLSLCYSQFLDIRIKNRLKMIFFGPYCSALYMCFHLMVCQKVI